MKRSSAALVVLLALVAGGARADDADGLPRAPADPVGRTPSNHQDSLRLSRLTSGVLPPDGLLTVGVGGRTLSTVYPVDTGGTTFLERVSQKDAFLLLEAGPLPWLFIHADLPWRSWTGGRGWIAESGSGLADGHWQVTSGGALWPGRLHLALFGGGNLPLGNEADGLGEGVFSPRAGAALSLRLWTDNQVPELRLHLNLARTWNRNETGGFGTGRELFQPWPPQYQPASEAGGEDRNDATTFGVAAEFRQGTTSLWAEYSQDRFAGNGTVAPGEQYAGFAAGLRWGVLEGWAVEGRYEVSLANDDETTAWWPGFPDWTMGVAVTKQFSIGGRDRDRDGVRDRHDRCPDLPEDRDGFQDDDGCPDYDNDRDGIPDVRDLCPDDPEDYDGFQDDDGCPDYDNDQDGIPDAIDLCPDDPEDYDGHQDDDGCPDDFADRDGDGVEDSKDQCPDEPEDLDGFEDDDGCPDLDNDMDGIPDDQDECPDEPETYNGIDDHDGCPD
ncbi:MAG: hypothetical protein IH621_11530 [Krumholzibacteria bacterium]|nr:hypothetical protein [Candidatus Krumholzibacteria bacterium]